MLEDVHYSESDSVSDDHVKTNIYNDDPQVCNHYGHFGLFSDLELWKGSGKTLDSRLKRDVKF